jgi:hypothetical protein
MPKAMIHMSLAGQWYRCRWIEMGSMQASIPQWCRMSIAPFKDSMKVPLVRTITEATNGWLIFIDFDLCFDVSACRCVCVDRFDSHIFSHTKRS